MKFKVFVLSLLIFFTNLIAKALFAVLAKYKLSRRAKGMHKKEELCFEEN